MSLLFCSAKSTGNPITMSACHIWICGDLRETADGYVPFERLPVGKWKHWLTIPIKEHALLLANKLLYAAITIRLEASLRLLHGRNLYVSY